jgi:glycosyltransferase involved in cell wall biosynthesis
MSRRLRVTFRFFYHLLRDVLGTVRALLRRQWRRHVLGEEVLAVGVDIFPFFERMSGVGWYEWNLLARLPEVDPAIELHLYAHTFAAPDEASPPAMPSELRTRFRFHHIPQGFLLPIAPTIKFLRTFVEPVLLFLDRNDVFFAPNFFVPRRHLAAVRALVATVHDLAFLRLPKTLQRETLENLRLHLPGALFASTALVAVSGATASDLEELAAVNGRRIHVIHEGVDPAFDMVGDGVPHELPARYLLFISTLEPRKNVLGLLAGFERAVAAGYPGDLVMVGRWGWHTEEAQAALRVSPARGRIHHLDYLERGVLASVFHGAEALLFPSLLEGFGLPVVEAMACGLPVIVSRCSSLPEVAGDAALYVDPADPDTLAAAILRISEDEELRRRLRAAGLQRAALFRWEDAARATAGVLRGAAGLAERFPDAYRV